MCIVSEKVGKFIFRILKFNLLEYYLQTSHKRIQFVCRLVVGEISIDPRAVVCGCKM